MGHFRIKKKTIEFKVKQIKHEIKMITKDFNASRNLNKIEKIRTVNVFQSSGGVKTKLKDILSKVKG